VYSLYFYFVTIIGLWNSYSQFDRNDSCSLDEVLFHSLLPNSITGHRIAFNVLSSEVLLHLMPITFSAVHCTES
jgi:hypothetical protein